MRLGATLVHLADTPPWDVATWSRRLVDAGFESLWTPELIGRGPLRPDPLITLAVAATATSGVELGTATVQVPLHHPVELAHRVLSLRAVAGPRLTLGVSPGSTAADYDALGRDYRTRFETFRRKVERLRTLLDQGGDEHATVAPLELAGGVPLLLGSWGANVERAAHEFDGWLASGTRRSPDEIIAAHERYRAAGGGRAIVCTVPVGDDLAATAQVLERYRAAGFDDAVMIFAPGGPDPERVRALLPRD